MEAIMFDTTLFNKSDRLIFVIALICYLFFLIFLFKRIINRKRRFHSTILDLFFPFNSRRYILDMHLDDFISNIYALFSKNIFFNTLGFEKPYSITKELDNLENYLCSSSYRFFLSILNAEDKMKFEAAIHIVLNGIYKKMNDDRTFQNVSLSTEASYLKCIIDTIKKYMDKIEQFSDDYSSEKLHSIIYNEIMMNYLEYEDNSNKQKIKDFLSFVKYLVNKKNINDPTLKMYLFLHDPIEFQEAINKGANIHITDSEILNKYSQEYNEYKRNNNSDKQNNNN